MRSRADPHQRLGLGMVAQVVRRSSVSIASAKRARCWVTSTRATARSRVALQDGEPERAHQDDVAGGGAARLPKPMAQASSATNTTT